MKTISRKYVVVLIVVAVLLVGQLALPALAQSGPWDTNSPAQNAIDYPDLFPDHMVQVGMSGGFPNPAVTPRSNWVPGTPIPVNALADGEVWTGRYVTYEKVTDADGNILQYAEVNEVMRLVGYQSITDNLFYAYELDGEGVPVSAVGTLLGDQSEADDWRFDYSGWVTATLYAQAQKYPYVDPLDSDSANRYPGWVSETGEYLLDESDPYVYMTSHLRQFSFDDWEIYRGEITGTGVGNGPTGQGGYYVSEEDVGVFTDLKEPNSHYVVWRVHEDLITDSAPGEATIRFRLAEKDIPDAEMDVIVPGEWYTSESTEAWFRPHTHNGYYYTKETTDSDNLIIYFSIFSPNAGNGLASTILTDHDDQLTLQMTIGMPNNPFLERVYAYDPITDVENLGANWYTARNIYPGGDGREYEYHLYWEKDTKVPSPPRTYENGQPVLLERIYIITVREKGTQNWTAYTIDIYPLSGFETAINLLNRTSKSNEFFQRSASTLKQYYASSIAWGDETETRQESLFNPWWDFPNGQTAEFDVRRDSRTIVQTMTGLVTMRLEETTPPTATPLIINKSLSGFWQDDWDVDETTPFGMRLQRDDGRYMILNPVPGPGNQYVYGGFTQTVGVAGLNTLFYSSEAEPAELLNVPVRRALTAEDEEGAVIPPYVYTIVEDFTGWGLEDWQIDLITPTMYDIDGATLRGLTAAARPDGNPVLDEGLMMPNFTLEENVPYALTVQNNFGHGVGFLQVIKMLTGYYWEQDVDRDTVFYARIWDVEAENYLLFDPVPRVVGAYGETLWCVGNHIVGLTEVYEQFEPDGVTPRPQPIMEIPFSFNNPLLLSNLWTWGSYEVHEVMPTDAALAPYLASHQVLNPATSRLEDPAILTAEWQAAVDDMIAAEWTGTWEGIPDVDRDFGWDDRWTPYTRYGKDGVPGWTNGAWMYEDWEDNWAPVYEILDELGFGINTDIQFGVNYTEKEQMEDGKLNFNEVITWTATNKFKYPSTNLWIGKRLDGAHLDWGVGPNTWFYMQVWNAPDEEDPTTEVQLIFERRRISGARGYDYHVIGHIDQDENEVFYWIEPIEDSEGNLIMPAPEQYYAAQYARNDIVTEVRVRSNLEQRVVGLPTEELFGRTFAGADYVVRERLGTAARQYVTTSYYYESGYDSPGTPSIIEDDLRVLVTNYYNNGNGTLAIVSKWFPCGHGVYYGFCGYEDHGFHSEACSADSNTKNSTCTHPHTYIADGVEYECTTGGHYWCGGSNLHVKGEGDFATTSRENTWLLDGKPVDIDTTFYFTMSIWRWAEGLNPNEIADDSYLPNSRNPNWVNPDTGVRGWVWPARDSKGYFIDDPQWGEWEELEFVLEDGIYNRIPDNIDAETNGEDPQFMGAPTIYLPIAVSREATLGNLAYQESYKITEYVATEYDLSNQPIAWEPIESYQRIGAEPDDPNGLPWMSYEVRHAINFILPEKYLTFYALEFAFGQENLELAGIGPEAYKDLKPGDVLTRAQATAMMAGALSITDFGAPVGIYIPSDWTNDIPWSVIQTATSILRDEIGIDAIFYAGLKPGGYLTAVQANALIAMGVLDFEDVRLLGNIPLNGDTLTLPADWSPWAEGLPPYTHITPGNRNALAAYGVTATCYAELEQKLLEQIALGQRMPIDLETATGLMTAGVFTMADLCGTAPVNLFNNFRPSTATLEVTKNVADWPTHFTGGPANQVYYFRVIDMTGNNRVLRWRTEPASNTYFCLGNGTDHFDDPAQFASYNYGGLLGANTVIAIRGGQTIELQNLWGEREYRVEEVVLIEGNFVPAIYENAGYTPSYAYGIIESELRSAIERERPDLDDSAFLINGDVQAVTLTNTYPPYYSVSYDVNGGEGTLPDTAYYLQDETVTVTDAKPTRDGYIFVGWNTEANGSGTDYEAEDTFTMPAEAVTLYARWVPYASITIQKSLAGNFTDWGIMPNTQFFVRLWCSHELESGEFEPRPLIFERTQGEGGLVREYRYRAIGYLNESTIPATPIYYYPELDGGITEYVTVIQITPARAQKVIGIPVGEEHNYFIEEVGLDPAMVSRIDISYTYNEGQPVGPDDVIKILPWDEGTGQPDIDIVVTNRYTVGGGQAVLQKLFSSGMVEDHTIGDCIFAEEDTEEAACINEDHYFNFGLESRPYTWPGSAGQSMDGNPWWNDTVYYATMALWVWENDDYNNDMTLLTGTPQYGLRMPPDDAPQPRIEPGNGSRWYYVDTKGVGSWVVLEYTQPDLGKNEYDLVDRLTGRPNGEEKPITAAAPEDLTISFIPFSYNQKAYLNDMSVMGSYKITEYWGEPFEGACLPNCVLQGDSDHPMCFIPIEQLRFVGRTTQPWVEYWVEHEINFNFPEEDMPSWAELVRPDEELEPGELSEQQTALESYYAAMGLLADPAMPNSAKTWYDSLVPLQSLSQLEGMLLIQAGIFSADNLCGTAPVSVINNFRAGVAELEVTKVLTNDPDDYDSDEVYTIMITDMSFDTRLRWELESIVDGVRTYRCIGNDEDKFSDPGKSEDGGWQNYIEISAGETIILNNLWSNCTYQVIEYANGADIPYTPEIWIRMGDTAFDPTDIAFDRVEAGFAQMNEVHLQNGETAQVLIDNIYPDQYTVTYDPGTAGATVTVPPAATVPIDTLYEVAAGPFRTGYTFLGWLNDRDGKLYQTPDGEDDDSFLMPRADVRLTAQWGAVEYTVTYAPGFGIGANYPDPGNDYTVVDEVTVLCIADTPFTRDGYAFLGWTPTGVALPDGADYFQGGDKFRMPAGNVTLIAAWELIDYTVTYVDGSTGSNNALPADAAAYNIGDTVTVKAQGGLLRPGYTFLGWRSDIPNDTKTYLLGSADETFSMPADNVVLTAVWRAVEYDVTYNPGAAGGTAVDDPAGPYTVEDTGIPVLRIQEVGFTYTGYNFVGWETEDIDYPAGAEYFQDGDKFDMLVGGVRFTAIWEAVGYTVTYMANNGTGVSYLDPSGPYTVGGDLAVVLGMEEAGFTYAGYNFVGWTTTDMEYPAEAAYFQGGDRFGMPPRDVVLTAQWELIYDPPLTTEHYAYMIGDNFGNINPQHNITRCEVATIFFRLITDEYREEMWSQENPFPDVARGQWFNNAVSTMANAGIFIGRPDGTFAPHGQLTRGELAVAVSRFLSISYDGPDLFTDIEGHWARWEINAVGSIGWIAGFGDGTFKPDDLMTRAEMATLINRFQGRRLETVDDMLPGMVVWPDNADTTTWYYLELQEASNSNKYELKENRIHKYWTELVVNRDWARLERPESMPRDIAG